MTAERDLLFGLIALQVGLIDQSQLVAAFQAWALDKSRPLADRLAERGWLDDDGRAAVRAMADLHVKCHGGDTEKSLASIPVGRSTRERLAAVGDLELTAEVARLAEGSTDPDPYRTDTYAVGAPAADGRRFRVLRPHARGGLGAVFVALDEELHREVALKQILDHQADDASSRRRFLLEAEITGRLEHPGIVPVYGLGTDNDGRPYYAMRFVKGDSLKETISRFHAADALRRDAGQRSLALRKLLRRFVDVCNAIGYAHSRGVLHRDIKPGNVIVGRYGETLVIDWGLAKALGQAAPGVPDGETAILRPSSGGSSETLPGSALGTLAYMSPEQAAFDPETLGPRSDVYSLGATLYCLLTGRPPIELGEDVGEALRRVRAGEFPTPRQVDPAIDPTLEAVCRKAMATRPEDRYPSCRALADDVERWAADEAVAAWREPWGVRARRWMRRHRAAATAAAVALAVVSVAAVAAALITDGARRREAGARQQADLRKTEAVEQGRLAEERRREADAQRAAADARRREALSTAAGAQLDRARALADGGQVGLGMLWTARALDSAVQAGDADLARVARANLALDRLRLPAVWLASEQSVNIDGPAPPPPADMSKLPAGQRVIVVSPDRRVALAEPKGGPARLFDLADGHVIVEVPLPYFFSNDFGPDSKTLVLSSPDGSFRTIDTASGTLADDRLTLPAPPPGMEPLPRPYEVRFLAGGTTFLVAAPEGRLTLRVAPAGRSLGEWGPIDEAGLPIDRTRVRWAADPGGARFAIATTATTARAFDAATGHPVGLPIRVKPPIHTLILAREGRSLWILAGDEARPYRVDDGQPEAPPMPMKHAQFIGSSRLIVRADGQVALGTDPVACVLLDVPSGRVSRFPHQSMVGAAAFSDDGRFLLTGEYRVAVLRDARTGRPVGPPLEAQSVVTEVGFARGGTLLTVGGQGFRAYEVEDGQRAGMPLPAQDAMVVAYRPDGREVATASREGIRRWDTTSRPIGESIIGGPATGVSTVLYSPDGKLLFASSPDKPWRLIETATGRLRATVTDKTPLGVFHARFSPDGTLLATSDGSTLRFWDTGTGRDVGEPLPLDNAFTDPQIGLSFHPKGRAIAAVSASNGASVWVLPSRQPAFPTIRHNGSVMAVEYSPDGSRLGIGVFSGGLPVGALLVNADTGRTLAPLAHTGLVLTMAFSPDGRLLLTGSQDRTVKFWDARDGKPASPTLRLATDPRVVEIAPDGRSFLTVENWNAADPRARLWDLATHRPLGPPLGLPGSGRAYAAAFAPDSRSVVIGSFRPGEEEAPKDPHDAVIWHLPPPVPDDATPERIGLWVEGATGYALAADNSPEQLSPADWKARNDRLKSLGGPPIPPPVRSTSQGPAARTQQQPGMRP